MSKTTLIATMLFMAAMGAFMGIMFVAPYNVVTINVASLVIGPVIGAIVTPALFYVGLRKLQESK